MKKLLFALLAFVACMTAQAKTVKITLADGSVKVYTSSQLSAIDFNDDGSLTVTTYDNKKLEALDAEFEEMSIGYESMIYEELDDVLSFEADVDGLPVDLHFDREGKRLNYVYTSTDPYGNPVTLSGCIIIPIEIWNKENKCEGIILYNHYTVFNRIEAPTMGFATLEGMLLANPLKPDYIIVESDFYGFGATERFPQAFLQGTVNAHASLDGFLAAKELLDEMGFEYGALTFNIGYSSCGFDALATQKCRDMEYSDKVSFDKTFAGGSPSDIKECYRQYVTLDRSAYNAVPLLLMVSTKETQNLDMTYEEVFQPDIVPLIEPYVLSKEYSSWPVCDIVGRDKWIHEILSDDFCNLESEKSLSIQNLFETFGIAYGWTPDPTQNLYIFHSRGDDYVPVQSARPILSFLQANGFKASAIPGATNLQTNFLVPKLGHLSATLVYLIQTISALKAWPLMYENGQLKPEYQLILHESMSPVDVMRYLDTIGFDCRTFILGVISRLSDAQGEGNTEKYGLEAIQAAIHSALAELDLTEDDVREMLADSGIDLNKFVIEILMYLSEQPETSADNANDEQHGENVSVDMQHVAKLQKPNPATQYEEQLKNWMESNGVELP